MKLSSLGSCSVCIHQDRQLQSILLGFLLTVLPALHFGSYSAGPQSPESVAQESGRWLCRRCAILFARGGEASGLKCVRLCGGGCAPIETANLRLHGSRLKLWELMMSKRCKD